MGREKREEVMGVNNMFNRYYDPEALVSIFHRKFNHPVGNGDINDISLWEFRLKLIKEEYDELSDAVKRFGEAKTEEEKIEHLDTIMDSLGDLLYVIYGTAVTFDIPIYNIFETIHKHNMLKLGEDGNPIYDEHGKVQKGPRYIPPSFKHIAESLLKNSTCNEVK